MSLAVFIASLILAYKLQKSSLEKGDSYSFIDFMNDGKTTPSLQDVTVGLVFGIVFGMMDTIGTWVGMKETSEVIPWGNQELRAAVAGSYSNVMSLTAGTLVTLVARAKMGTSSEQRPIWVNIIGILIGSSVGIFIGHVFLR
tara:strand:- start:28953 stop:29378 length:426 start_codon:yes stop_codon:yes gene_type:complete